MPGGTTAARIDGSTARPPMTAPSVNTLAAPMRDCLIVRQPIFDTSRQVIGYELLCRSTQTLPCAGAEEDGTTHLLSDALSVFGLQPLTGGGKAFLPLTRAALLEGYVSLLPREHVIMEIPSSLEPDADVLQACRQLRQDGYPLALDRFQPDSGREAFLELADILKIDFQVTSPEACRHYPEQLGPRGKVLLAQEVETWQQQQDALSWGYRYLQGFFFCQPEVFVGKDLAPSKVTVVRLLAKLCWSTVDFASVEQIIKQDPPLSLKLIAYLNSALFARRHEITSIRQAVVMLGLKNLQRWVSLFAAATLAEGRPSELFRTCLVRARFCELLGHQAGLRQHELDLFLIGLLSALDAMLGQPLEELFEQLAVADNIRQALSGGGEALGQIYALARAYERGDWETVHQIAGDLGIASGSVVEAYLQALQWADDTSGQVSKANRAPMSRTNLRPVTLSPGSSSVKKPSGNYARPSDPSRDTSP